VIDSNSDPKGINFPIPGNDDALRAINLYCDLVAGAVFDGLQSEVSKSGRDLGESEEGLVEDLAAVDDAETETSEVVAEAAAETGDDETK
jgi:small subunit ribosomal protein S2